MKDFAPVPKWDALHQGDDVLVLSSSEAFNATVLEVNTKNGFITIQSHQDQLEMVVTSLKAIRLRREILKERVA